MVKKGLQIKLSSLVVLVSIFLVAGCPGGAYVYENVNASGTVVARDKDSTGKVTSVEIKTESATSLIVEDSGKGKELIAMIDKKVEISGKARQENEKKWLTVESYKVIE